MQATTSVAHNKRPSGPGVDNTNWRAGVGRAASMLGWFDFGSGVASVYLNGARTAANLALFARNGRKQRCDDDRFEPGVIPRLASF